MTDSHVFHTGYAPTPDPPPSAFPGAQTLTLVPRGGAAGDPASLRTLHRQRGIAFSVAMRYRVVRSSVGTNDGLFAVLLSSYAYQVLTNDGAEILVFHWHPEDPWRPNGKSEVRFPHLHPPQALPTIDLGPGFPPVAMRGMHIPTGSIEIEDVVELLIREFDIAPLREDWRAVLAMGRRGR